MSQFNHADQIKSLRDNWDKKPVLRAVYAEFYGLIHKNLSQLSDGKVVELGSGIGAIKDIIPDCITTDMFQTQWNDRVENAYSLSYSDASLSDIILVDVFHHLKFPGTALKEFYRVLRPSGRVLVFEPCLSMLGLIVYGVFHHEPINLMKQINWEAPHSEILDSQKFYAAQGNASRIFLGKRYKEKLKAWNQIRIIKLSALSYLATGGYRKPQLLPDKDFHVLKWFEDLFDNFPSLFATRVLVVLEK
jgi:SAM-dependent methyltransferase